MMKTNRIYLSRRGLLRAGGQSLGVGLGAMGLGALGLGARPAMAASVSGSDLKFLFVVCYGGWDPTRVFASELDNPFVDLEGDAGLGTSGDLRWIEHDSRPAVTEYMSLQAARTLFFNGVLVQSIAHENCLRIQLTGSTAQDRSDWGAILAGERAEAFALPQVVVGGPSFPGDFGAFVTRTGTGGQLTSLLSGDIAATSDTPVSAVDGTAEAIMDRYLRSRSAARLSSAASGEDALLMDAFDRALEREQLLKSLRHDVPWSAATTFAGQARLAIELMSLGLSRVSTLSYSLYGWDTHTMNDTYQALNFQGLFTELNAIHDRLARTPGTTAATLADETVVVVMSEMGRTPQLNGNDGKDHWPYTATMVTGPNIRGGRVIGGYDSAYYGRTIDPATGDVADDATNLSSDVVGATLLALGGVDPSGYTTGVEPVLGALA